jgi:hypothetical protein
MAYNPAMKLYVLSYRPRQRGSQKDREQGAGTNKIPDVPETVVLYSKEPQWKITARELADAELRILRNMQVHVGLHYCNFSVEELSGGDFTIVCLSHPDPSVS